MAREPRPIGFNLFEMNCVRHLGLAATFSTTDEPPFAFARRASTLDRLRGGRFGWNIVTSYLPDAPRNFGLPDEVAHDERYAIVEEFLDVVDKLSEGLWDDDIAADREQRVATVPGRVRGINHAGERNRVEGPVPSALHASAVAGG